MNDFKSCYHSAVQDMVDKKEIHIDAQSCMDRKRHRRRVVRQLGRSACTILSTASLLLVCGLGTVKAATYLGSIIRVKEWGFMSGDAVTMTDQESQVWVIKEELAAVSEEVAEETVVDQKQERPASAVAVPENPTEPMADTHNSSDTEAVNTVTASENKNSQNKNPSADSAASTQTAGNTDDSTVVLGGGKMDSIEGTRINSQQTSEATGKLTQAEEQTDFLMAEGVAIPEEAGKQREDETMSSLGTSGAKEVLEKEIPVKTYYSLQEFQENENIVFPQPSIPIQGTMEIMVCDTWAMSRYDTEGRILWLERTDYANTQGHSAAKVFPEGVYNERTYTNAGGYTYTLVDSVQTDQQKPLQIHGAIAVGTYEVFIDFYGYTEAEAKQIIDSIDLSLYESTEGQ